MTEGWIEALRESLVPWYLQIKFVHLLCMILWAGSTAVAYGWYVKQAYLRWERAPDDPARRRARDFAFEQFDRGAVMEHVAFPLLLVSGLLLLVAGGFQVGLRWDWLLLKLAIVVGIFVPMEIVDCWLAHFGGNKTRLREAGDPGRLERMVQLHWRFLRTTTRIIVVFVPLTLYLVVVKPF